MQEIDINVQRSSAFITLATLFFISTGVIIFLLPINLIITILLFMMTAIYIKPIFSNFVLLVGNNAILKISLTAQGWEIQDRQTIIPVELCGESTVTTWVSVLRFHKIGQKRKYTSVLFRDSMEPDVYRRLIMLLRTTTIVSDPKIR